jgi:outer membrane protein assembly factor BamE (lipoprotein component of BamABCDE complex)
MRALKTFFFIITLSLTACYHPDIDQGNHYAPEMVKSLKIGMQKVAVIELLGNPILNSPFDSNELIYVYYNYPNKGKTTLRHLTLTFKNNILVAIQDEPTQAKR